MLTKLFHYGFDNLSLKLMGDYFANRSKTVRFSNAKSNMHDIKIGVPQGSVFGPILFLIQSALVNPY